MTDENVSIPEHGTGAPTNRFATWTDAELDGINITAENEAVAYIVHELEDELDRRDELKRKT